MEHLNNAIETRSSIISWPKRDIGPRQYLQSFT